MSVATPLFSVMSILLYVGTLNAVNMFESQAFKRRVEKR